MKLHWFLFFAVCIGNLFFFVQKYVSVFTISFTIVAGNSKKTVNSAKTNGVKKGYAQP